ncbi:uncharacterized protein M421DRAFT_416422 [Didymella exigua CBS 183.55]|uniref:DUF3112 domain-containing protein n=1 Tax=Didymella exigua CBS 183.55 TaxID=1150837 RepID=A0A6A5RZQ1_9PLEO|nr:uncharacterized protein M421DRAFT_416422 [Didymella exigua CBS 183.55]KAF1932810.1 hypothetical protein M421DRAFT_416422 [Didymella exigua CBS 183.55]
MSTVSDTNEPSSSQQHRGSPPYSPTNAGLGGSPDVIPDIPVTAVFLVLYLILGVVHIKILKSNKGRGHKFIFNGALLGLCKIRLITMSLRIAWACHQRNVGLAMAANIFVYVGTIILYMVNWFFTQRVVRAQHTKLGWSMPYRIVHRGALVFLIVSLLMIIVTSIWQNFTLNKNARRIFRDMQLAGQTYFTVFAFAPIVFVLISLALPRHETDKFGAGRLRVNITILLIAAAVVSAGQIFRCVIVWLPPSPLRNAQGQFQNPPWYYDKACFFAFNFVTEIIVLVMYAIVRVDLRFHVPDGAKRAGDYSRSSVNVHVSEKALHPNMVSMHSNGSNETLHSYQISLFEDSGTLADSLRYPLSTLEIDGKTGAWKVKRASGVSTGSNRSSTSSQSPTWLDKNTMEENDIPPVPDIPNRMSWPLRTSMMHPNDLMAGPEHDNPSRTSKGTSKMNSRSPPKRQYELKDHGFNDHDVGDAVRAALNKLEGKNDSKGKLPKTRSPPPGYNVIEAIDAAGRSSTDKKYIHFSRPSSFEDQSNDGNNEKSQKNERRENGEKRSTVPMIITKDGRKVLRKQRRSSASEKDPYEPTSPVSPIAPEVYVPTHMMSGGLDGPSSMIEPTEALTSNTPLVLNNKRSSSLEIIKLTKRVPENRISGDSNPRILDLSTMPKHESTRESSNSSRSNSFRGVRPDLHEQMLKSVLQPTISQPVRPLQSMLPTATGSVTAPGPGVASQFGTVTSSIYSSTITSSDQREVVKGEEEFRRFSFEAAPEEAEQRLEYGERSPRTKQM